MSLAILSTRFIVRMFEVLAFVHAFFNAFVQPMINTAKFNGLHTIVKGAKADHRVKNGILLEKMHASLFFVQRIWFLFSDNGPG